MKAVKKPVPATRGATTGASSFKDLNVVYNEELNRRDGYWSSSSSGDDSDTEDEGSRGKAAPKLRAKAMAGVSKSEKVTAPKDFRMDSKEKAKQEWLWATGQLGVAADTPKRSEPKPTPAPTPKPAPIVAPSTTAIASEATTPKPEQVSANVQIEGNEARDASKVEIPTQYEAPASPPAPTTAPSRPIISSVPTKFHSLEYLEADEYKKAEQEWDFERPFLADNERKEAKKRAAELYYAQQQQPSVSVPSELFDDMPTVKSSTANVLDHYATQHDQWRSKKSTEDKFRRCVDALEALVSSDLFINKIQRFLQKHHRSLLSTKLMRDRGEYCHEDYAVYKAYVNEMEGIIMKALRDGAEAKGGVAKGKASRPSDQIQSSKPAARTVNGVQVIMSLEEDEDEDDQQDAAAYKELDTTFDEEEFFDYLFNAGAEDDEDGRGDVLSFDAWEAILSVLHFNSFIDLVDEYVAAEYGIDDMDVRGDTKTARRRGLPQQNQANTPPPTPLTPSGSTPTSKFTASVSTPVRSAPQPEGATPGTPSPPKKAAAVGSGAAMRRLVPSTTASKGFASSTSSSAANTSTVPRANSISTANVPTRAPGSAPSSTTARSTSKGRK